MTPAIKPANREDGARMRVAIAEACGWKRHGFPQHPMKSGWWKPDSTFHDEPPDYCNDLNAMHEAEKVLTDAQVQRYVDHLADVTEARLATNGIRYGVNYWSIYHATAAQRAEAFLRTIEKWEI